MSRKLLVMVAGLVLTSAGLHSAISQPAEVKPDVAGVFYTAEAAAVVEPVDQQARQVLLRLPDQSLVTLNVGPEVANLNQLKPGDHVVAKYIEAAAVRLASPGEGQKAPASAPPTTGAQIHGVSKVVAVDQPRNTVSFAEQNNHVQTIVVHDPSIIAVLKTLKAGDPVDVTYTEGIALSLTPAPA
jgi:hypothetical protein